ncbi:MAG: hypothetical protein OEW15_03495 [Nitrospirota bacterium]|nr:hypothetical protein [Nitrospirota bacterium]
MSSGIPVLTQKGKEAVKNLQINLTARCRNILVQVDGKRSLDDIRVLFRGLDGLEDGIQRLVSEGFIDIGKACTDIVKELVNNQLGTKSATLLRKIDEMHGKYGDTCWEHLDELNKAARLFYGEIVAQNLTSEITKILKDAKR